MFRLQDYPQLKNNFFLQGNDAGASRRLRGKVALLVVFLKRTPGDWPDERKQACYRAINESQTFLQKEAGKFHAPLELTGYHFEVSVPANADPKDGFRLIKDYFQAEDMESLQKSYEQMLQADEAAFLLLFDDDGRSFAVKQDKCDPYASQELSVIFFVGDDEKELSFAMTHELLHQFGAVDFYFPERVRQTAERYLPDNVMRSRCYVVDDLTAFLVGWRETLSAYVLCFLQDTMWITRSLYSQLLSDEWKKEK
jgi:hypothetical protein